MASGKEIRTKIKSVQNTRKITKAMEMVAASKMRKAQDRMRAARPFAEKIRRLAANLSQANVTDYKHPFLVRKDQVKRVGLILVTTDKGLCGGLNTNVQRVALTAMKEWDESGVSEIRASCIGNWSAPMALKARALSNWANQSDRVTSVELVPISERCPSWLRMAVTRSRNSTARPRTF